MDTLGFLAREIEDFELARSVLCGSNPLQLPNFDERPLRISLFRGPHWQDGSIEMRDPADRSKKQ